MTSSPDRKNAPGTPATPVTPAKIDPLPPALSSMWRLCKTGVSSRTSFDARGVPAVAAAALPDALLALWLMLLGKGVLDTGQP